MTLTKKKTQARHLTKVLLLTDKEAVPVYAGGVTQFSLTHNLGYIPAFKVFFQDVDNNPQRMFSTPSGYDNNVTSVSIDSYLPFTCVPQVTPTTISFGVTNRSTRDTHIKVFVLIYAEKAGAKT